MKKVKIYDINNFDDRPYFIPQSADKKRAEISVYCIGHPCVYCGESPASCWDHMIPFCWGGSNEQSNMVPACLSCNSKKNDLFVDEFHNYCMRRNLPFCLDRTKPVSKLGYVYRWGKWNDLHICFVGDDGEMLQDNDYFNRTSINAADGRQRSKHYPDLQKRVEVGRKYLASISS